MSENTNRSTAPDNRHVVGHLNLHKTEIDKLRNVYEFADFPVCADISSTAAKLIDGTAGEEAIHQYADGLQLYASVIGTQTIDLPQKNANGMDYGYDQADDEGINWTMASTTMKGREGINKFTVGGPAFYAKLKFSIAVVAGTDDCAFGFRKVEAVKADINGYDEMASLNVISGTIYTETIINAAANVSTSTTDSWANAATHTLEVYVSALGVVTYKIDGVAPTVTTAFSFDIGEVVTPFFYMINATASQAGAVVMQRLEVGYQ